MGPNRSSQRRLSRVSAAETCFVRRVTSSVVATRYFEHGGAPSRCKKVYRQYTDLPTLFQASGSIEPRVFKLHITTRIAQNYFAVWRRVFLELSDWRFDVNLTLNE
jgi:hypothetical protein